MKELSIEEKAKRYDERLEKAREEYENHKSFKGYCGKLVRIFPELKESVEEKMVKFIKQQLFNIKKTITENYELDAKLTKAIDWLEKQCEQKPTTEIKSAEESLGIDSDTYNKIVDECIYGDDEQKPFDKVEPKFKVGDVMRTLQEAADGMPGGMPVIISIDKEYYHCTNELIAIKDQDEYEYPPMNRRIAI